MWNFGIPYKLKQWIDVITQPGLAFRFDPAQGYLPLGGRSVLTNSPRAMRAGFNFIF